MNQIHHNDEENNSVKKLLDALPNVDASADFEQRLQRRLTQTEPKLSFFGSLVQSRFVPAFAYSVMALIAVGVVSYYIFMRTGTSVPAVNESNLPAVSGKSEPVPQQQEKLMKNEPAVTLHDKQDDIKDERQVKPAEPKQESMAKEADARNQNEKDLQITRESQLQSVQGEVSGAAETVNQVQEEAKIQQAPVLQQTAKRAMPSLTAPSIQSQTGVTMQYLSVQDSLRRDSLQRIQQQLLRQKAKSKKPL